MRVVMMYDRQGNQITPGTKYTNRKIRAFINSVPIDEIQVYCEGNDVRIILGKVDTNGKETTEHS